MAEDLENALDKENLKVHDAFSKPTIREVKSGQRTFSTPDHEIVKPTLEIIMKGEARAFIVALETKQGIKFYHKSLGSDKLMELLVGSD